MFDIYIPLYFTILSIIQYILSIIKKKTLRKYNNLTKINLHTKKRFNENLFDFNYLVLNKFV